MKIANRKDVLARLRLNLQIEQTVQLLSTLRAKARTRRISEIQQQIRETSKSR